jgi:hypothetical protein
MRKKSLLIAMRRASTKQKKAQQKYEMSAKDLFIKILEVKRRIHKDRGNNNHALDSEGSEADPSRKDLEDIVNDFVVKGQQTDSLMLQNNRLAKEVEERTRHVMELEERVAGNAQIKKKKEEIQGKKDHLDTLISSIDKYKLLHEHANEVFKEIKPQVHRLFQLLKCDEILKVGDNLHNVYFQKNSRKTSAAAILNTLHKEVNNVNANYKEDDVANVGNDDITSDKNIVVESSDVNNKTNQEEVQELKEMEPTDANNKTKQKQVEKVKEIKINDDAEDSKPASPQEDKSHEKDSVFYYHNPMLALGLIEMQVQNVMRCHTLDAEILQEPELDKKPTVNSPLKRVKLPKSKDYDQIKDGSKDDEPPLYFMELQSETKFRGGQGLEYFHQKTKAEKYRRKGRRKGVFNHRR